jgi:hypothetical protein
MIARETATAAEGKAHIMAVHPLTDKIIRVAQSHSRLG